MGKSAVFILDPSQSLSDSLNDINLYWKSSLQTSDWLWNGANYEYGSPLLGNYINPSINIELTSGHSSYLDINSGNFICLPESDGLPGGEVELKLFGTAVYGEVNSTVSYTHLRAHET